jgi:5-methylcytosine-specific restriction enzyme subunit McrC
MSADTGNGANDTSKMSADIQTKEHNDPEVDGCAGLQLSDTAITFLEAEVNGGDERKGDRIGVTFDRSGRATLKTNSYVGVVSLPDGPTIEIKPKVENTQLLHLLRYANGIEASTFEEETPIETGDVFIEAIGALFESELSTVLTQGLHTEYETKQGTERRLRGRLDLQRQLTQQSPQPTAFECTYDELTPDVTLNQAVLYATSTLLTFVQDSGTARALRRHRQQLRRRVSLRPVAPIELESIETTRLNEYCDDLLRLTKLILRNVYVAELSPGRGGSYSILVNMNTIFEKTVERAAAAAISEKEGWEVRDQDRSKAFDKNNRINLQPDFTVADAAGTVQVVGDAKWKTESPKNEDFYQIAAYQSAFEAPGLVVYPNQDGAMEDSYEFPDGRELTLIELPTTNQIDSFETYTRQLETSLQTEIQALL